MKRDLSTHELIRPEQNINGTTGSTHIYYTGGETEARIGQVDRTMFFFSWDLEAMGLTWKELPECRQASPLPRAPPSSLLPPVKDLLNPSIS